MLQSYSSILSSSDALLSLEDINYAQYERMDRLRDDDSEREGRIEGLAPLLKKTSEEIVLAGRTSDGSTPARWYGIRHSEIACGPVAMVFVRVRGTVRRGGEKRTA